MNEYLRKLQLLYLEQKVFIALIEYVADSLACVNALSQKLFLLLLLQLARDTFLVLKLCDSCQLED